MSNKASGQNNPYIETVCIMSREIKVLCVGDVVGNIGCEFLRQKLSQFKKENNIDICIVNGEN